MNAELSYFIQEGVLVGKVGERPFHILALSGGGGGSSERWASSTAVASHCSGRPQVATATGASGRATRREPLLIRGNRQIAAGNFIAFPPINRYKAW